MIAPVRTIPPAAGLIDLRLVKDYRRKIEPDEDFLLGQLVQAAVDYLDGWRGILGRCIATQTWRSYAPALTDQRLPFPDVQSVTSVKYLDANAIEQTLSASVYRFGSDELGGYLVYEPGAVLPQVAVREDAVRIEAVYGFASVPYPLQVAIAMIAGSWDENREGAADIPPAARSLIAPYRCVVI